MAVGEDVELLDDLVGVGALGEVDEDFNFVGGVVVEVADFEFSFGVGGEDGFDEGGGRHAVGEFGDG